MKTVSSNLTVVLTFSVALLFFNESSPAQIIFDDGALCRMNSNSHLLSFQNKKQTGRTCNIETRPVA